MKFLAHHYTFFRDGKSTVETRSQKNHILSVYHICSLLYGFYFQGSTHRTLFYLRVYVFHGSYVIMTFVHVTEVISNQNDTSGTKIIGKFL